MLKQIYHIAVRECGFLRKNPIYIFCMVIFPITCIIFFTSLMDEGQPIEMPIGVVDLDNTATTRSMIRKLDGFQTSQVVAHYPSVSEARQAIQRNQIYAFLYIPKGTTSGLLASRQPKISFYYSSITLVAGSTLFRDLKTVATLGSAAVGAAKLSAMGKTSKEIATFLQPIAVDLHMIGNPWGNYNIYLSTSMLPGVLMIFIFLITPYSIGTELKFKTSQELIRMAGGNIHVAIIGKMLPQLLIFLAIFYGYEFYIYHILQFPHPGGIVPILLAGLLAVLSAQSFGIFAFGLMPSLRMSMSICSLWAMISFSTSGATFPLFAMNPMIEALAQLFPLRHYYMIYQTSIFNGYPLADCFWNIGAMIIFIALPILTINHIKTAMEKYVYIP